VLNYKEEVTDRPPKHFLKSLKLKKQLIIKILIAIVTKYLILNLTYKKWILTLFVRNEISLP